MGQLRATVIESYESGTELLVFPTEVVAAAWRRTLVLDGRRAIERDRIISWDRFKQLLPGVHREQRPASSLSRQIFAHDLLSRSATMGFRELFNAEYPESARSSVGALARTLTLLPRLRRNYTVLRASLADEYEHLAELYHEWLNQYGLFEASWDAFPPLGDLEQRPLLFFPELLDDFHEYESWFGENGRTVSPAPDDEPVVHVYLTFHDEIAALFSAIEKDVADGASLHEIVVSVADLDSLRPWLELEGHRRGLPVRFAGGRALVDLPGARWVDRLDELVSSNFSVVSLAALVLDQSIPWRSTAFLERMIEFGYRTHCYGRDEWEEAFELAARVQDGKHVGSVRISAQALTGWRERFRKICSGIERIVYATSVVELSRAISAFVRTHLEPPDHERWRYDAVSERVLERVQRELATLENLERYGLPIERPWTIFLDYLSDQMYVPQGQSGAVQIYPYRVAAGIPAARHYTLNMSHNATRVRPHRPMGVRSEELGLLDDHDFERSAAFLRAYTTGDAAVRMSSSTEGARGAQVLAAELVTAFGTRTPSSAPENEIKREIRWWDDQVERPRVMYRPQHSALVAARAVALADPGPDFQTQGLPQHLIENLRADSARLGATAVRRFETCPYSFFLAEVLGIEEQPYGYKSANPLVLGLALHSVFEIVLANGGETRAAVDRVFDEPLTRLSLPRRGEEALRTWYAAIVDEVLADDQLGLKRPGESEVALSYAGRDVSVYGKADRVIGLGETDVITIVDYKLSGRSIPSVEAVIRGEELQIPLYQLMVQQRIGREVDRTAYVNLKGPKIVWISDRGGRGRQAVAAERLTELVAELPDRLDALYRQIMSGAFMCREESDCGHCGARSICRRCYATRRYSDAS